MVGPSGHGLARGFKNPMRDSSDAALCRGTEKVKEREVEGEADGVGFGWQ